MLGPHHSLVFDLDGTLVDTAPDLCNALNHVLGRIGRPAMPLATMRNLVGHGARAMINDALEQSGVHPSGGDMAEHVDAFLDYYADHIADESRPFPGVVDALKRFQDQGIKLGVCTNKREALSVRLLDALDLNGFFPVVLGADSVPAHKPDPGHLLATIDALNGNPKHTTFVGDSPTDVATARAANVPVVAVRFGYTKLKPEELGADQLIDHYDDLDKAIVKLLAPQTTKNA